METGGDGWWGLNLSRSVQSLFCERATNELWQRDAVRGWDGRLSAGVVGNDNVQGQWTCTGRTISSMSSRRVRDGKRRYTWTLCQVFLEGDLSWRVTGSAGGDTGGTSHAGCVWRCKTHPFSLGDAVRTSRWFSRLGTSVSVRWCLLSGGCRGW